MSMTHGTGILLAATLAMLNAPNALGQTHTHPPQHAHHHPADTLDVSGAKAPQIVELRVLKDPASGYNLFLKTANFTFAPELASGSHAPGKGHAHIYIDGVKTGRLYGSAFHLDKLAPGTRKIEVTLNANDHRDYAVSGKKISATTTIHVP